MRLDLVVLARLAAEKPLPPAQLARQLRRLAAPGATEAEFRRMLTPRLDALAAAHAISRNPLRITDAGRKRLLDELGVAAAPPWRVMRDRYLPALALGLRADAEVADLRAAVLGGDGRPGKTLVDELVAAELGIEGKLTLAKVRAHVLARRFGVSARGGKVADVVGRAAAAAVKAPRGDERTLRIALAQRWLADDGGGVPTPAAPAPVTAAPRAWTDADLLAAVRDAMLHVPPTGRFGDDKVFISAIWRQLGEGRAWPGLTLDGLKQRLVAANQQQQLTLARADLVGAMDPREVAASETRYLNATFHFVLDRSRA